jgi:hypothetical protein
MPVRGRFVDFFARRFESGFDVHSAQVSIENKLVLENRAGNVKILICLFRPAFGGNLL